VAYFLGHPAYSQTFAPPPYTWGDSDVILSTIMNAAILEVSYVAAVSRGVLSYACKVLCGITYKVKMHGLNNFGIRMRIFL